MPYIHAMLLGASALLVGAMIGCTGIGGLLLPPALLYIVGLDIHAAVATSMWSFVFMGGAGAIAYARRGTVDFRAAGWLVVGIAPAAILGAVSNVFLPGSVVSGLLAALIVASGVNALTSSRVAQSTRVSRLSIRVLLAIGALVGFGSALTGSGGPVLLVPIMLLLQVPVLRAVGVSQVIQIVVALFSTVGYATFGGVDFALGGTVGVIATLGVVGGAHLAHQLPALHLRRVAATVLIVAGVFTAVTQLRPGVIDASAASRAMSVAQHVR